MGRFTEALRQEAEANEAEVRATICGLDEAGLVAWCRSEIKSRQDSISNMLALLTPKRIISSNLVSENEALGFARIDCKWFVALFETTKKRRKAERPIPQAWQDYLLNCYLEIEKKPDERGTASHVVRNQAIWRCIWQIKEHTLFKATRSYESIKPCAVSIVAQAIEGGRSYDAIKRVWNQRDKSLFP